jgi:cytidine/deoxycytidylate deaminase-like protein
LTTSERSGRPCGAVLVKDGEVLATGANEVAATNDPTAHAEVQAIRSVCAIIQVTTSDMFPNLEPHIPTRVRRGAGFLSFSATGGRLGTGSGQVCVELF